MITESEKGIFGVYGICQTSGGSCHLRGCKSNEPMMSTKFSDNSPPGLAFYWERLFRLNEYSDWSLHSREEEARCLQCIGQAFCAVLHHRRRVWSLVGPKEQDRIHGLKQSRTRSNCR